MFEALTKGFRQAKNRLAGLTELTEANIEPALREVRLSLLEADVELGVVKAFLARVKEASVGETVATRVKHEGGALAVTAADQFVKICHDELIGMMAHEGPPIAWADKGPTGIMMVGLQGSGKTTSSAKLARWLQKDGHRPLLVAADMQRPAAVEQLKVLGASIGVPVFNLPGQRPLEICTRAVDEAKKKGHDVILFDTAGRLAIDAELMAELDEIKASVWPENVLLVVDSMIGQDAVKTAKAFHDRLGLTGVVLTKLDGDARGGAALSVKTVTGAPVLFSGIGETTDKFEEFRPEGMASRILGMGDVVGLMKDFEEVVDRQKAEKDAARLLTGEFTLDDFLEQVRMIKKMGSLQDLVEKIPMLGAQIPEGVNLDDKELVRIEAMIQSMTRSEKDDPYLLVREPGRVKRVAKGSGQPEPGVVELVNKFVFMKQMIGSLGQGSGMLGAIPGMKQLAMARKMRKAMKGGGFPGMGMPGMGMPGMGMPGMGMPGMGMPGMPGFGGLPGGLPPGFDPSAFGAGVGQALGDGFTKMKTLSKSEKNAKKSQRKRERDARKKGRR